MNLGNLKAQFVSKDNEHYEDAENVFLHINALEIDDFIIGLLDSDESYIRARSCSLIRDKKLQSAVPSLLKNIFKKENQNNTGSMVFALTELDCSKYFVEIFKTYIFGGFEAKNHANTILDEQEFDFTKEQFKEVEEVWANCKIKPELCPCYDYSKKYIEKDIEYFRQELHKQEKS